MRYLLVLFSCISILYCAKNDNNPVEPQLGNDIFPLEIGNYWIYENIYYNDHGYEVSRDTSEYSVVRDTLVEGESWFKLAYNGTEYGEWCANRSGGYWIGGPSAYLYYKYPAQTGDQYAIPDDKIFTVENDSDVVNVTAGEFCCVSYMLNIPGWNGFERSKLSPGFGLIWIESWEETNDNQIYLVGRIRLLSYLVQ